MPHILHHIPHFTNANSLVLRRKRRERIPKEEANVSETKTSGGKLSGINAAYEVLREAGEPLNIKQIMEQIIARNLAKLNGKTPHSTISAALQMEIKRKGDASRFEKAGKGLFRAK